MIQIIFFIAFLLNTEYVPYAPVIAFILLINQSAATVYRYTAAAPDYVNIKTDVERKIVIIESKSGSSIASKNVFFIVYHIKYKFSRKIYFSNKYVNVRFFVQRLRFRCNIQMIII